MFQSIKHILFSLFFLSSTLLFSQSKTQLEKEKQQLEIKITQTNKQLILTAPGSKHSTDSILSSMNQTQHGTAQLNPDRP